MSEAFQDIRDYFADRFSSPFWISFIVAWLVINWELPITAIFESELFNATIIESYLANVSSRHTFWLPFSLALAYSIFSSSFREILEILSKIFLNLISYIDRNQLFYKSISITRHQNEIKRLERQLQKMDKYKEEITELSTENEKLEKENSSLKIQIKNREDGKDSSSKETLEIESPNKVLSESKINDLDKDTESTNTLSRSNIKQSYRVKMQRFCSEHTMQKLRDPNSRASILLLLVFLRHQVLYTITDLINESGFSREEIGKKIRIALDADLIREKSNGKFLLTPSGNAKLSELMNEADNFDVIRAIQNIDKETENHIIKILRDRSLNLLEIKNLVFFNPNLIAVLNNLISKEIIHKEGNVYFFGKKNTTTA